MSEGITKRSDVVSERSSLCLVLGGNGFVGSHLVDELVAAGYRVRAFDRFSNAAEPKYLLSDRVEKFVGDIYDPASLRKSLKGVNYVFHSFSATTPFTSDDDPYSDIDKNLKPSVTIFQECVRQKVKKVVYISSGGAVYGELAGKKAATENDAPMPVSPYGIIKLSIEGYQAYFKKKFGLEYVAYRLTNPYGPRQAFRRNQGVVPLFVAQIKEGKTLTVYGDGSSSRDYIYIRDATKMIVDTFAKKNRRPVYNIGSGRQTSLNEIIKQLQIVLGKEASVKMLDVPKTFLKNTSVSIKRFETEFGEQPTTSLKRGLEHMIND